MTAKPEQETLKGSPSAEPTSREPITSPEVFQLVRQVLAYHQTAYAQFHCSEGRKVIESHDMAIGTASVFLEKWINERDRAVAKSAKDGALENVRESRAMLKHASVSPLSEEQVEKAYMDAVLNRKNPVTAKEIWEFMTENLNAALGAVEGQGWTIKRRGDSVSVEPTAPPAPEGASNILPDDWLERGAKALGVLHGTAQPSAAPAESEHDRQLLRKGVKAGLEEAAKESDDERREFKESSQRCEREKNEHGASVDFAGSVACQNVSNRIRALDPEAIAAKLEGQ